MRGTKKVCKLNVDATGAGSDTGILPTLQSTVAGIYEVYFDPDGTSSATVLVQVSLDGTNYADLFTKVISSTPSTVVSYHNYRLFPYTKIVVTSAGENDWVLLNVIE
jgi:hypothetical protein